MGLKSQSVHEKVQLLNINSIQSIMEKGLYQLLLVVLGKQAITGAKEASSDETWELSSKPHCHHLPQSLTSATMTSLLQKGYPNTSIIRSCKPKDLYCLHTHPSSVTSMDLEIWIAIAQRKPVVNDHPFNCKAKSLGPWLKSKPPGSPPTFLTCKGKSLAIYKFLFPNHTHLL